MTQSINGGSVDLYGDIWARVRGRLRSEAGDAAYGSWLKPLTLVSIKNGVVRMAVPTRFMRDWVLGNYKDVILSLWREEESLVESSKTHPLSFGRQPG